MTRNTKSMYIYMYLRQETQRAYIYIAICIYDKKHKEHIYAFMTPLIDGTKQLWEQFLQDDRLKWMNKDRY